MRNLDTHAYRLATLSPVLPLCNNYNDARVAVAVRFAIACIVLRGYFRPSALSFAKASLTSAIVIFSFPSTLRHFSFFWL
jgi:hypothetical protein